MTFLPRFSPVRGVFKALPSTGLVHTDSAKVTVTALASRETGFVAHEHTRSTRAEALANRLLEEKLPLVSEAGKFTMFRVLNVQYTNELMVRVREGSGKKPGSRSGGHNREHEVEDVPGVKTREEGWKRRNSGRGLMEFA